MTSPIEILLNRRLSCESFNLIMTVSRYEGQDQILAVLKLFAAHGSISNSTVNTELLAQPAESHYGQNVLKAVELYGLIKSAPRGRYELTELGNESLNLNKVPIPNRGLFRIVLSHDPLLSQEILDIVDIESNKDGNLPGNKIGELPQNFLETLEKSLRKTLLLPARNKEAVSIIEIAKSGSNAQYDGDYGLSLSLKQNTKPRLYFNGKSKIQIDAPKDIDLFHILEEMLLDVGKLRDVNGNLVLLVKTKGLTSAELSTFRKNFTIRNPTIQNYGSFDPIQLNNLQIAPVSLAEAEKWARKLLVEGIDHYVDKKRYGNLVDEISRRFEPTYEANEISSALPDYNVALQSSIEGDKEFSKSFWYLVAPHDLTPRRRRA